MKTKTKFILLGLISFLVGSAFATPLLISELEIVPFWTIPQGPKADFKTSIVFANFSIRSDIQTLDYFVLLNITNLSDLSAKISNLGFEK